MSVGATGKKLTDCPSNLKEAIDWILRVTGKDGQSGGGGDQNGTQAIEALSSQVMKLLESVKESDPNFSAEIGKVIQVLGGSGTTGLVTRLADGLKKFIGYGSNGQADGKGIIKSSNSYQSAYDGKQWSSGKAGEAKKCAQIFLGCLPIYYYWLTYLYWKCKQSHSQGGWEKMNFNGSGGRGQNLKAFMVGQGYVADHLSTQTGKSITPLLENVDKFTSVTNVTQHSHPDLLCELDKKLQGVIGSSGSTIAQSHSLTALFYLCRCYFTGKHIMQSGSPTSKPRPPTSIREMLYWLSGLQFSPHYSDIEKQIETIIPQGSGLPVADSAMTTANNIITQSQMKGFLLSSCLSAPGVLGAIQGNSADSQNENGEPWLYSLFCNSMNLRYPSGSALFNTLANYAYSLQFQLGFLFSMCATNGMKCGWQECRYGSDILPTKDSSVTVSSHICHAGCDHGSAGSSNQCSHNGTKCGQSGGKASPLQAFLTDNLQGFCRGHPGTSGHLDNHLSTCSGPMCHTPMGFEATHLRQNAGTGNYIYAAFYSFCGRPDTPLRQLSEKLGCLTKRTPRTLGDLFGFVWHLNGQLFKNTRPTLEGLIKKFSDAFGLTGQNLDTKFTTEPYSVLSELWNKMLEMQSQPPSATGLSRSLEAMAPTIPFLYQLFMTEDSNSLPGTLFDLNQHCHKRETTDGNVSGRDGQTVIEIKHNAGGCSNSPNDLWSLYQPVRAKPSGGSTTDPYDACRNAQCGGYLSPLTHSAGATYAPVHASVYLSWLAYLTDDFHEWFQNLLDEFKNIDCTKTGCRTSTGGKAACISKHPPGTHGNSTDACSCDSVVHCGGVLPVLYRHGFQFYSPHTLSGGSSGNDQTKRNCHKFQSALSNVLSPEAPLAKLLESIDDFLYLFRFYFFYNQSAFWTIYVCIIFYTFFFLLDTLRVRSHLHFPSSNSISPISLLGTRKAPALTKLTKLTYFMP
ncbi:uncharacterized protein BcabD6B2_19940 [Babesia caballi]|uniref:Variant erythrocyte surface antigen-1, beta subunit n=1 Tax=Babesia caballi TaxID=5871 RepID=A0AAV4LRE1_BABCB|nr:hypothetical protein, conserved [Babesia caballi]